MPSFLGKLKELVPRAGGLPVGGRAPELPKIAWLNGGPLAIADLYGRVVLIEFWTTSCVNCLRTLPHLQAWHEDYGRHGLTIIGIHTPEFTFEDDVGAVRRAAKKYGLTFPIALDDGYAAWNNYGNRYWPGLWFVDAGGSVRAHHYGEGGYADSERTIRSLLAEAGADLSRVPLVSALDEKSPPPDLTPETRLGWSRLEYLGSPETVRPHAPQNYSGPKSPTSGIFYLRGRWQIEDDYAEALEPGAGLSYRIRAAEVFAVLDGPIDGRLTITADGQPLTEERRGSDAHAEPDGRSAVTIDGPRLYHILSAPAAQHSTLEITCLDAGVRIYSLAFG
jgi:thiol-disulfide isomerase/thioredoxin